MHIVYWARLGLARPHITQALQALDGVRTTVTETLEQALAALPGADGLVTYDAPPRDAQALVDAMAAPGATLRWLHLLSAGREGFEAAGFEARLRGRVAVTWAAGGVSRTVAEHAMALLLGLARRLPEAVAQVQQARWDRGLAARARSLEDMTVLVLGLGHIGREFVRLVRPFAARVVGVTRTPEAAAALPGLDAVQPLAALPTLLPQADAIVVALALTPATRHLLDGAAFEACRRGVLVVNVARGGVIDGAALAAALHDGRVGGAGLDVTEPEPLPEGDALWRAPNLLLTPHFAGGGSAASLARLAEGARRNAQRLRDGAPLLDRVV